LKRSAIRNLFSVIVFLPATFLVSQTAPKVIEPPKAMRLCVDKTCLNLKWVEDHYEGHEEDARATFSWRYWITNWDANHIEFTGKTTKAVDGVFPLEATFTGKLVPGGGSISGGSAAWRIGYSKSGTLAYTLLWDKQASNKAETSDISVVLAPRRSIKNPNILLPPGASEEFASFPPEARAILQPEYPLTPADSKRPCEETKQITDSNTALEIGKFAFRAGEMDRGACWIDYSIEPLRNIRGNVIRGMLSFLGFGITKDPETAFKYFSAALPSRDPWGLYFLEQCYMSGAGTPKDLHQATIIESWMMTHQQGQDVFMSIGADDAEQMRIYRRGLALMFPPTKSKEVCTYSTYLHTNQCHTESEVDDEALQEKLNQINSAAKRQ
jgi:hypothetical protein